MIGELKDIWIVFKKAYNEHFALKLKALDAIKEYEMLLLKDGYSEAEVVKKVSELTGVCL